MDPANTSRTVAGCAALRRAASKREKAKHFKYAHFSSLDARLSLRGRLYIVRALADFHASKPAPRRGR